MAWNLERFPIGVSVMLRFPSSQRSVRLIEVLEGMMLHQQLDSVNK